MTMKFKTAAVVAATVLASTGALAADPANIPSGNSSLAFIALDATGTPSSLFVDLSYLFSDFAPGAALVGPNQTVVWNFNTNSVTVNGAAKPGTYNWSAPFAAFQAAAQAGETGYGVIAGVTGGYPDFFLTTGTPTAAQLAAQQPQDTLIMGAVATLYGYNSGQGTFPLPGYGGNAAVGTTSDTSGSVAGVGNFGVGGNWQQNLMWNALKTEGTANDFYWLDSDPGDEVKLGGQFSYAAGVLTWATTQTAPIPEPSGYMIAMAGLAVLGFAGRRRRDDR